MEGSGEEKVVPQFCMNPNCVEKRTEKGDILYKKWDSYLRIGENQDPFRNLKKKVSTKKQKGSNLPPIFFNKK